MQKIIVVDLEFSALDLVQCGIFQIGALKLENPKNQFFNECRIDNEDLINKKASIISGKNEAELRDKKKLSQKQLLEKFYLHRPSMGLCYSLNKSQEIQPQISNKSSCF